MLLPSVLTVDTFDIYPLLRIAIDARDSGILLIAAFFLVLLNSLRALPIYIGSYVLCIAVFKNKWLFRIGVITIVYLSYCLTSLIYLVRYDFGIPSVIVIFIIYLLDRFHLFSISLIKRSVIVICVLIGVQFLDVMPALTPYGFGRGIVSMDIKTVAQFVDRYDVLTPFSAALLLVFLAMALLISRLLSDQHKLLRSVEELSAARLAALEARKDSEIRNLVHDLKTPLTAIEALAEVSLMLTEEEKLRNYLQRICVSTETMSEMISQILDTARSCVITMEDLFSYSLFQVTSQHDKNRITVHNQAPQACVRVNKILFSRALINVINNALDAIDPQNGHIFIAVSHNDGWVCISIADDGCGIPSENLQNIWAIGFSGHGSTGLGLSFVKDVVETFGGSISLFSTPSVGTTATIRIREASDDE